MGVGKKIVLHTKGIEQITGLESWAFIEEG